MALNLPSWLDLPNFVAAMRSGAEAGIQARQQDREEASAGDRLRLAYEGLHEKERTAALQIQARQQQASDALALRTLIAKSTQENREQQAKHAADALNATIGHYGEISRHDRAMEDRARPLPPAHVTLGDTPGQDKFSGPVDSPIIQSKMAERKAAADALKAKEDQPTAIGDFIRGLAHPFVDHPDWRHPFTDPSAKSERVKVVGPDGKKGTVPKGTTLPEGWKLDQ